MQEMWVRSLAREDPTCCVAIKLAPQLLSLRSRPCEAQLMKPCALEPMLCNKRARCNETPAHRSPEEALRATTRGSPHSNQDPAQPQRKKERKLYRIKIKTKLYISKTNCFKKEWNENSHTELNPVITQCSLLVLGGRGHECWRWLRCQVRWKLQVTGFI